MRKILLLPVSLVFLSCNMDKNVRYTDKVLFQMGTLVNVTIPADKTELMPELAQIMQEFEDIINADSVAISHSSGDVGISGSTYELIDRGREYQELSKGRFNPAIYTLVSMYGFPEGPFVQPSDAELEQAMTLISSNEINLFQKGSAYFANGNGLAVDFGAYAKGWIVDKGAEFLKNMGVDNFIINAGGDLYASGSKSANLKWRIGITDPDKERDYITVVELKEQALATSGVYERFFIADDGERVSHIFDATTGKNARMYKSLSVIAKTTELADALSTLYFLMTPGEIESICQKYASPVFYITLNDEQGRLCGWEEYEID